MSNIKKSQGGFTLIELLIVVLIIGILAAIAIPVFNGQRAKAKNTHALSTLRNAQTAADTHALQETYEGIGIVQLREQEESLEAPLLSNSFTPGSSANPNAVFVGGSTGEVSRTGTGDEDGITLCVSSQGDKTFCSNRTTSTGWSNLTDEEATSVGSSITASSGEECTHEDEAICSLEAVVASAEQWLDDNGGRFKHVQGWTQFNGLGFNLDTSFNSTLMANALSPSLPSGVRILPWKGDYPEYEGEDFECVHHGSSADKKCVVLNMDTQMWMSDDEEYDTALEACVNSDRNIYCARIDTIDRLWPGQTQDPSTWTTYRGLNFIAGKTYMKVDLPEYEPKYSFYVRSLIYQNVDTEYDGGPSDFSNLYQYDKPW